MTKEELKQAREELGLTQVEFGKAVGMALGHPDRPIHQVQVSHYETGTYDVPHWMDIALREIRYRRKRGRRLYLTEPEPTGALAGEFTKEGEGDG